MLFFLLLINLARLAELLDVKGDDYPFCTGVGTKKISITWDIKTANSSSNHSYSVFYCRIEDYYNHGNNCDFKLGCQVNSTTSKINTCVIGKSLQLNFPEEYEFVYYIQTDDGLTQVDGPLRQCHLNMHMRCTDPTGLSIHASSKRALTLKWHPPADMGEYTMLCYRIKYSVYNNGSKVHSDIHDLAEFSYTIETLLPYTNYVLWLQCALDCTDNSKWSNVVGPVMGRTLEEVPQGEVMFLDYKILEEENTSTRTIVIYYKLPLKEMWNGNVTHVQMYCFNGSTLCSKEKVPPSQQEISFVHLATNAVYNIQAQYCNKEGCSNKSYYNVTVDNDVQKQQRIHTKTLVNNDADNKWIIITASVIVGAIIIIAIITCIYVKKCRNNGRNAMSLGDEVGDLGEPVSGSDDDNETIDPANNSEYASVGATSRLTLHPETADFQSSSARSLRSFNISISEQSSLHDTLSIQLATLGDNSISEQGENIELEEIT